MDPAVHNVLSHVDAAQAALDNLSATPDVAALKALRTIVAGFPDTGAPGAGEVVSSLFVLLEQLIAGARADRDALQVHIDAWRLMLTSESGPDGIAVLLTGLKAVRDRGNPAKAA